MSSAEERREARRRRRARGDDSDEVSESSAVNGEDDLERRRRERREARLRAAEAPAEEETTSRRGRRNRGGDDETPAEEVTSSRSRRRRGGDDEDATPKEEPKKEESAGDDSAAQEAAAAAAAAEAEERRRRQQAEEEEERRREEEKERKQQEAEQRRKEEEERAKKEEEERKRKNTENSSDELWQNDSSGNSSDEMRVEKSDYFRLRRKEMENNEAALAFYTSSNDESHVLEITHDVSEELICSNMESIQATDVPSVEEFQPYDAKMAMLNDSSNADHSDLDWEMAGHYYSDDGSSSHRLGHSFDDADFDNRGNGTVSSWKSEACLFVVDTDVSEVSSTVDTIESIDRCSGMLVTETDVSEVSSTVDTIESVDTCSGMLLTETDASEVSSTVDTIESVDRCSGMLVTDTNASEVSSTIDMTESTGKYTGFPKMECFSAALPCCNKYGALVQDDEICDTNDNFKFSENLRPSSSHEEAVHKDETDLTTADGEASLSSSPHNRDDYCVKYGVYLDVEIDFVCQDSSFLPEVKPIWIENPGQKENYQVDPASHRYTSSEDTDCVDSGWQFTKIHKESESEVEGKHTGDCSGISKLGSSDVIAPSTRKEHFETIDEGTESEDIESKKRNSSFIYSEEISLNTEEPGQYTDDDDGDNGDSFDDGGGDGEDDELLEVITKRTKTCEGSDTSIESILGSEILSTSSKTGDYDEVFEDADNHTDGAANSTVYISITEDQQNDDSLDIDSKINYTETYQTENNDYGFVLTENISNSGRRHSNEIKMREIDSVMNDRVMDLSWCSDGVFGSTQYFDKCKREANISVFDELQNLDDESQNLAEKERSGGSVYLNISNLDEQTQTGHQPFVEEECSGVNLQLMTNKDELYLANNPVTHVCGVTNKQSQDENQTVDEGTQEERSKMTVNTPSSLTLFTEHTVELQPPVESSVFVSPRYRTSISNFNFSSALQQLNESSNTHVSNSSNDDKGFDVPDSQTFSDEAQKVLKASASAYLGKLVDTLPLKANKGSGSKVSAGYSNPESPCFIQNIKTNSSSSELTASCNRIPLPSFIPVKSKTFLHSSSSPLLKDNKGSLDFKVKASNGMPSSISTNQAAYSLGYKGCISSERSSDQINRSINENQTEFAHKSQENEVKTSVVMVGRKVLPTFDELKKSKLWERQVLKNKQNDLEPTEANHLKQASVSEKQSHTPLWLRIHRSSLPMSDTDNNSSDGGTDNSSNLNWVRSEKKRHSSVPKIGMYLKQKFNSESPDYSIVSSDDFSPNSSFISESGSSVYTEDGFTRAASQRLHPFMKTQSTPTLFKHFSHYRSDSSLDKHTSSHHSVQILNQTAKPWQSSSEPSGATRRSSQTIGKARSLSSSVDKQEERIPLNADFEDQNSVLSSPRPSFSKPFVRRVSTPDLDVLESKYTIIGGVGINATTSASMDGLAQNYASLSKSEQDLSGNQRWLKTQSLIISPHKNTKDNNIAMSVNSTLENQRRFHSDAILTSTSRQDASSMLSHVRKEKQLREQKQNELIGVIRARQHANQLLRSYPLSDQMEQLVAAKSLSPKVKGKKKSVNRVMTVREKYCLDGEDSDVSLEQLGSWNKGSYASNQQTMVNKSTEVTPVANGLPIGGNSSLLQRIENIKHFSEQTIAKHQFQAEGSWSHIRKGCTVGDLESVMISGNVSLTGRNDLKMNVKEDTNFDSYKPQTLKTSQEEHAPEFKTFESLNKGVATSEKSKISEIRTAGNRESSVNKKFEFVILDSENQVRKVAAKNENDFCLQNSHLIEMIVAKDENELVKEYAVSAKLVVAKEESDVSKDNINYVNLSERGLKHEDEQLSHNILLNKRNDNENSDYINYSNENKSDHETAEAIKTTDVKGLKRENKSQKEYVEVKNIEIQDANKLELHTGHIDSFIGKSRECVLQKPEFAQISNIDHGVLPLKSKVHVKGISSASESQAQLVPVEKVLPSEAASQSKYAVLLQRFEAMAREVTQTAEQYAVKNKPLKRSVSGSRVSDFKSKFFDNTLTNKTEQKNTSAVSKLPKCADLAVCENKVKMHPPLQKQTNVVCDENDVLVNPKGSVKETISGQALQYSNSCPKFTTEMKSSLSNDSRPALKKGKFLNSPQLENNLTHSHSCPKLDSSALMEKARLQRDTKSENMPDKKDYAAINTSVMEKFEKLTKDLMEDEASRLEKMKTQKRMQIRRLSSGLDITKLQRKFSEEKQSYGSSSNLSDSIKSNSSVHSSSQKVCEVLSVDDTISTSTSNHRSNQKGDSSSVFVTKIASKFSQQTNQNSDYSSPRLRMSSRRSTIPSTGSLISDSSVPDSKEQLNHYRQKNSKVSQKDVSKVEELNKVEGAMSLSDSKENVTNCRQKHSQEDETKSKELNQAEQGMFQGVYVNSILGRFKQTCDSSESKQPFKESTSLNCTKNMLSHWQSFEQNCEVLNSEAVPRVENTSCPSDVYSAHSEGGIKTDKHSCESRTKPSQTASYTDTSLQKKQQQDKSVTEGQQSGNHLTNEDKTVGMLHCGILTNNNKTKLFDNTVDILNSKQDESISKLNQSTNFGLPRPALEPSTANQSQLELSSTPNQSQLELSSTPNQSQLEFPVSDFEKRTSTLSTSSVSVCETDKVRPSAITGVKDPHPGAARPAEKSMLCFEKLLDLQALAVNVTEEDLAKGHVWCSQENLQKNTETDLSLSSFNLDLDDEEEARMEAERLDRERQEQEEELRRKKEEEEKKKKGKRKGLGGLSPEKKKLLKKLIMQKAAEDLRNEAKRKAEEKEKYINAQVPELNTTGMNQADLQQLCKKLHDKICVLEEEVFDWEVKIRKQDFEINELTLKVNDTKGKFIKPVLRKVNKTESKLAKLDKKESRDFRSNLKSTGQNKFALDKEDAKKPDWIERKLEGEEAKDAAQAAAQS